MQENKKPLSDPPPNPKLTVAVSEPPKPKGATFGDLKPGDVFRTPLGTVAVKAAVYVPDSRMPVYKAISLRDGESLSLTAMSEVTPAKSAALTVQF